MATNSGISEVEEGLIETNYEESVTNFEELNLKNEILRGKLIIVYI